MKKQIIIVAMAAVLITGCSKMITALDDITLQSGEVVLIEGTDGIEIRGKVTDNDADGVADGIDVTGDGLADLRSVAAESNPDKGLLAIDTDGDGTADIFITLSVGGICTINTSSDGTGTVVTAEVGTDGITSFDGATVPVAEPGAISNGADSGSDSDTETDPGTVTPFDGDMDGDGTVTSIDVEMMSCLTFGSTDTEAILMEADSEGPWFDPSENDVHTLIIPTTYDGKPLTTIADGALITLGSDMWNITVPETVNKIGEVFNETRQLEVLTMLSDTAPTLELAGGFTEIGGQVQLETPDGASGYDIAPWINLKAGDLNNDNSTDSYDLEILNKLAFSETETEATITAADTSLSGRLVMPAQYNGKFVTGIGEYAFENCTSITSINFYGSESDSETQMIVGQGAFAGCTSLEDFSLNSHTAVELGNNLFSGCTSLEDVNFYSVGNMVVGNNLISGCTSLETFYITASEILEIGDNLFNDCPSLEIAVFGYHEELSFGDNIFTDCDNLKTFSISFNGATTSPTTTADSFIGLPNPVRLYISSMDEVEDALVRDAPWNDTNLFLKEEDQNGNGVAGETEDDTLRWNISSTLNPDDYTETIDELRDSDISGTLYLIDEIYTNIADDAFKDCLNLTEILINPEMETIGAGAFQGCTSIKKLNVLPMVAPTVGADTFDGITGCTLKLKNGATGYDVAPWNNTAIFSTVESY